MSSKELKRIVAQKLSELFLNQQNKNHANFWLINYGRIAKQLITIFVFSLNFYSSRACHFQVRSIPLKNIVSWRPSQFMKSKPPIGRILMS